MLKSGRLDVLLRVVIVLFVAITFWHVVKLEPNIDRFFFFAADDPASVEAGKVDKLFSEQNQVIINASAPNRNNPSYYRRVKELSTKISKLEGVHDIKSVANGPKNFKDAVASPMWSKFLFGKSKNSSLIIIRLNQSSTEKVVVPQIEQLALEAQRDNFKVQMSGMPFILEKIRLHLEEDMKVFSSSAVIIFGLLLVFIFASTKILIGTMLTCFTAIMLTLLLMTYFDISLGILTTNLSTIVFILAQSHIIFLTSNWQRIGRATSSTGRELAIKAMNRTFTPSFWCMITTLLGFLSLILVPAKPLKDLGLGGAIGTVVSIVAAYLIYPAFLTWAKQPRKVKKTIKDYPWAKHFKNRFTAFSLIAVTAIAFIGTGISKLDLDPGLHEYFANGTEIRKGLEDIDKSGGSSILSFVISNSSGARLDNKASYNRMWQLQEVLCKHPAVGTTTSLAHIIAETDRHPLSLFFPIRKRLDILSGPKFQNATKDFITADRKQAHFMMRMVESESDYNRGKVIEELKSIAKKQGFNVDLVGGVYYLQEELSDLIQTSIAKGIGMLLALFLLIAYIVTQSFTMSLSMVAGIALIPLTVFGTLAYSSIPLDIFATPAVNVCIGIAVDTLIHLAIAVKLHAKKAKINWDHWVEARKEQSVAILTSTLVVASGFSIFTLSYFPPTYRFGLQVVIGTLLAAIVALVIFPAIANLRGNTK